MNIDEIKEELELLRKAHEAIEHAYYIYSEIVWPDSVYKPHHVEMELGEVEAELTDRIHHIERQLERIL